MFRFTKKPSSGSHSQCLAEITRIGSVTLRCVIPVVCVTNEREESVVNQRN